jgi:hypothetical protein
VGGVVGEDGDAGAGAAGGAGEGGAEGGGVEGVGEQDVDGDGAGVGGGEDEVELVEGGDLAGGDAVGEQAVDDGGALDGLEVRAPAVGAAAADHGGDVVVDRVEVDHEGGRGEAVERRGEGRGEAVPVVDQGALRVPASAGVDKARGGDAPLEPGTGRSR